MGPRPVDEPKIQKFQKSADVDEIVKTNDLDTKQLDAINPNKPSMTTDDDVDERRTNRTTSRRRMKKRTGDTYKKIDRSDAIAELKEKQEVLANNADGRQKRIEEKTDALKAVETKRMSFFASLKSLPIFISASLIGAIGSAVKVGMIIGAGILSCNPISLIISSAIFVISVALFVITLARAFERAREGFALNEELKDALRDLKELNALQGEQLVYAQEEIDELQDLNEAAQAECVKLEQNNVDLVERVKEQDKILQKQDEALAASGELVENIANELKKYAEKATEGMTVTAEGAQMAIDKFGLLKDFIKEEIEDLQKKTGAAFKDIDALVLKQKEIMERALQKFQKERETKNNAEAVNILLNAIEEALGINSEIVNKNQELRDNLNKSLSGLSIKVENKLITLNADIAKIREDIQNQTEGLKELKRISGDKSNAETGLLGNLKTLLGRAKENNEKQKNGNDKLAADIAAQEESIDTLKKQLAEMEAKQRQLSAALGDIQETNAAMQVGIGQAIEADNALGVALRRAAMANGISCIEAAGVGVTTAAVACGIGVPALLVAGIGACLSCCLPDSIVRRAGKAVAQKASGAVCSALAKLGPDATTPVAADA